MSSSASKSQTRAPPGEAKGDESSEIEIKQETEEMDAGEEGEGIMNSPEESGSNSEEPNAESIEAFLCAFEKEISCRNKELQIGFMEVYGFLLTFRYVYEQERDHREKDSELALNALLSQYTGIESLNVLQVFLDSLGSDLEGFGPKLKPIDCILLTYMQLKVCISFKDLAKVFECDDRVACQCFLTTLSKIKKSLGNVIYWPSREETEQTIPKFFKPAFSNVRTIFTNLVVQISPVFSRRYVIGFAPSGFVSYISKGYNADTHSDEKIFRDEKIRQRFEKNQDALMVLSGFPIESILGVNYFRVFRPPFLVKTLLPDNKSRVRENTALYKHVLGLTTIFDKFFILTSIKNLLNSTAIVEKVVISVCVCINYNVMFRNT